VTDNILLYGEPLNEIPQELYIPPHALKVTLESFHGPLDLLLYLIKKQNFNILDIPVAHVTTQYLEYIETIKSSNFELAADYLLMAAVLLEIKAKLLIPKNEIETDDTDDPRADLVKQLIEYEKFKKIAIKIDALPRIDRDWTTPSIKNNFEKKKIYPEINVQQIFEAIQYAIKHQNIISSHHIQKESLSVRDHMTKILKKLSNENHIEFVDIIDFEHTNKKITLIIFFIALLELVKDGLVEINQTQFNSKIWLISATSKG